MNFSDALLHIEAFFSFHAIVAWFWVWILFAWV